MKKILLIALMLSLLAFIGCSDDDNPTGGDDGGSTIVVADSTVWSPVDNAWISNVDASSHSDSIAFTFADSASKALDWHIYFRRYYINLNGGDFGQSGDVVGADLGLADFDTISIEDTTGVEWIADSYKNFFNYEIWYSYNPMTHQITYTGNVMSLVDAEGDNYIKFTVDSITGGGAPPAMGTVHISYFYQSTTGSTNLSGTVVQDSLIVDMAHGYAGYYDFSTGSQVIPANPGSSTDWDIKFANYEIYQNSGPHGSGSTRGYKAYVEMNHPTEIDSLKSIDPQTMYLPDFVSSVFYMDGEDDTQNWYDYQPQNNHLIVSWGRVYLIKTEGKVFVMQLLEYYDQDSGASGHITFKWRQL